MYSVGLEGEVVDIRLGANRDQMSNNPSLIANQPVLSIAPLVLVAYASFQIRCFGIRNKCYIRHDMNFDTWMLRMTGKIGTLPHFKADFGRFHMFNNLWDKLHKFESLNAENMVLYRQMKIMLREYTICQTNAIIITMFNSGDVLLYTIFQPQLVVVDKANQAIELNMWNILGNYA